MATEGLPACECVLDSCELGKLRDKEYSSFAHAVEAAQIEEQPLGEAERHTHGELEKEKKRGDSRDKTVNCPFLFGFESSPGNVLVAQLRAGRVTIFVGTGVLFISVHSGCYQIHSQIHFVHSGCSQIHFVEFGEGSQPVGQTTQASHKDNTQCCCSTTGIQHYVNVAVVRCESNDGMVPQDISC